MLWEIELLYFVAMLAVFVILLLVVKIPAGISLMVSAIIGAALSAIFSGTEFTLRHFIEGGFAYLDNILVIVTAMIFMAGLTASGALNYFSVILVKTFHKKPVILLIFFMLIIMFPAMITGSSLSSVVCTGAIIAPILLKMGIPKAKAGAIVAFGSILGMIAPPINIPVMLICDVVDIPYIGFVLPLLALTLPLAIFCVLFLGLKHVRKIDLEEIKEVLDFKVLETTKWTVILPLIVLVGLIILQNVLPRIFGGLGMPLIFVIATIVTFFVGNKPKPFRVVYDGVVKSFSAMSLLMGVGMFVQILTLNGARGYFVVNALSLPDAWQYVGIAITLPIFGGISAFASASILGGPFVMALLASNEIVVASALSLMAALGEFLPPTAMSATFASNVVGEEKHLNITKAALIPLGVCLAYAMIFIIFIAKIW